jgi:hypothetical protein
MTDNFYVAYCVCDIWHTGADCSQVFSGTYVLIGVGVLLVVCILACVVVRVRYCMKPVTNHEEDENNGKDTAEKISLLGSTNSE